MVGLTGRENPSTEKFDILEMVPSPSLSLSLSRPEIPAPTLVVEPRRRGLLLLRAGDGHHAPRLLVAGRRGHRARAELAAAGGDQQGQHPRPGTWCQISADLQMLISTDL